MYSHFYTEKPLYRGTFTHKSVYTQQAFTHTGTFTQRRLYTKDVFITEDFTQRNLSSKASWIFYIQKLLYKEIFSFLRYRHIYTQKFLHRENFTQRIFTHGNFYIQRNLYTDALSHRETFTQRNLYTKKFLHTETFTHKNLYTEKSLHRGAFIRNNKLKLATILEEKPFAGAFGNSFIPKKKLFPTNMIQKI